MHDRFRLSCNDEFTIFTLNRRGKKDPTLIAASFDSAACDDKGQKAMIAKETLRLNITLMFPLRCIVTIVSFLGEMKSKMTQNGSILSHLRNEQAYIRLAWC